MTGDPRESVSLRTYAFIDRMQPQCAAHIAATSPGDVPLAGMAELYIEMAPGNEVFRAADIALKAAGVRPALQIIEREFGLLEIHSEQQAEVLASGQAWHLEYWKKPGAAVSKSESRGRRHIVACRPES